MPLVLTIVKSPENISITESIKSFGEQGGTLGRGDTNTWVLNDPDRYLSSVHCEINYLSGQYELVDLSTNGTFINNLSEPIGRGNRRILKDGDIFDLGDYVFKVSYSGVVSKASEAQPYGTPFADLDSKKMYEHGLANETDPFIVMNKSRQAPEFELKKDLYSSPDRGEENVTDAIKWPNAKSGSSVIPDDWDNDIAIEYKENDSLIQNKNQENVLQSFFSETQKPNISPDARSISSIESADLTEYKLKNQHLEESNKKLHAEITALKEEINNLKQNAGYRSATGNFEIDKGFINALGFGDKDLDNQQVANINQASGELLREAVAGMIDVLGARNNIKNEFRMNVTTIQPIENNPLKFSANIDDALENMFLKKGNSFKNPVQAFREGFQSIGEHQIAIMTGMRFAFKGLMDRFDPLTLDKRFEKQNKIGFIANKKTKKWNAYLDYYNELVSDMDNSFQYLFGDDFVHAYEEQLRKLTINNKLQPHNTEKYDSKEI